MGHCRWRSAFSWSVRFGPTGRTPPRTPRDLPDIEAALWYHRSGHRDRGFRIEFSVADDHNDAFLGKRDRCENRILIDGNIRALAPDSCTVYPPDFAGFRVVNDLDVVAKYGLRRGATSTDAPSEHDCGGAGSSAAPYKQAATGKISTDGHRRSARGRAALRNSR